MRWEWITLVALAIAMTAWSLVDYLLWPAAVAVWICVAYAASRAVA